MKLAENAERKIIANLQESASAALRQALKRYLK
jgi:hypothetical protein